MAPAAQALTGRARMLRGAIVVAQVGLPIAVVVGLFADGWHGALVIGLSYACAYALAGLVLHLAAGVYGQQSATRLWRERMASGFYKTLPPAEDEDD
jgi:hypothetical protein